MHLHPAPATGGHHYDDGLSTRIRAEFKEMPDLRLNLREASRLFNIEPSDCEQILGLLVQVGVLRRQGDIFIRAGSGHLFP